jgi:hypothetical protein
MRRTIPSFLAGLTLVTVASAARAGGAGEAAPAPASVDDALAAARRAGKPLVVELFAVW